MKVWWVIPINILAGVLLGHILAFQNMKNEFIENTESTIKVAESVTSVPMISTAYQSQSIKSYKLKNPANLLGLPYLSGETLTQKTQALAGAFKSSNSEAYIGKSAQLTTTQIAQLKYIDNFRFGGKFNFKVLLPTRIPPGFQLENFEASQRRGEVNYKISYRNRQNNSCFYIQGSTGSGGDMGTGYDTVEVFAPAFGRVILDHTNFDRARKSGYIGFSSYFISREKTSYSFYSPGNRKNACNSMQIQEAVKVVQSFQYLNTRNNLNFPKNTCGDKPTGTNSRWYPVFIDGANLKQIRSYLCRDAVRAIREKTGKPAIMLGSFISYERAKKFAEVVAGAVGHVDK